MPDTQRIFNRDLDSLAMVSDLIDAFTTHKRVDERSKHAVSVAVDGLFTSMVSGQPFNTTPITVELRADHQMMTVHLIDRDLDRFNPAGKPNAGRGTLLDERTQAGTGFVVTKQLMDDVQYRYGDRTRLIILKKKFRRQLI